MSEHAELTTLADRLAAHLEPMPKKERMQVDRHGMIEQEAMERARNFAEVNLGYTEQLAILEADRLS